MFRHSRTFYSNKKPPKWEIFNITSKTNVQYSVIFDKKRDLQLSIGKLLIEVSFTAPNYSKMSSCCIVDDDVNKQSMEVIFLDGNESRYLSLRLFFHKQLLMKKSNSLLVYFNKFKKNGIYILQNTSIYMKCIDGLKWTLFYDLFEFLVTRSGKSVIGAQFYIHFVCKDLIFKELRFLQSKNKKRRTANFSSSPNKYLIRKTKVSEIVGITSKRQFGTNICMEYQQTFDKAGKSEVLAKKRKFVDSHPVDKHRVFKFIHNLSLKIQCICKENKWQCFKPLVKSDPHHYTDILDAKGILNEITQSTSMCTSICLSTGLKNATEGINKSNLIPISSVKSTVTLSNPTKVPLIWKLVTETTNEIGTCVIKNGNLQNNAFYKSINKNILQDSVVLKSAQSTHSEFLSDKVDDERLVTKQELASSSKTLSEKTACCEKNYSLVTFQTASGKALKISEKAREIAQKLYSEVCSQEIDTTKKELNNSFSNKQEVKECNSEQNPGFMNASQTNLNKEYFGDNIDGVLDDKFFEEIPFDETDSKSFSQPGQSSSIPVNISYKSQLGKVKKSLGGRRCLKPYVKKSKL